MFDINGKKYAGLQFYFIVFPYKAGSFNVPAIKIVATTPPEGSSESKKVTIQTAAQHFTVKDVPATMKDQNWFVAKDVSISEKWSKPLQNLKVGDVIERSITIDAGGTLPQFIPQLHKDSLDFASAYLQDAELEDKRDDYDANGKLTQTIIYLLEKEGDFVIPAVQVKWWNPNSSKSYSRSAYAGKIHVKANPDLGIVATLKDSLQANQSISAVAPPSKKKFTIWGYPWYWVILAAAVVLYILYLLVRFIITQFKNYKTRHAIYLAGEQYAFRKFMNAPDHLPQLLRYMYAWWDKLNFAGKSSAVSWQMRRQKLQNIEQELTAGYEQLYKNNNIGASADHSFKKNMKHYRQEVIDQKFTGEETRISPYQSGYPL
jgi:hypothetical protein